MTLLFVLLCSVYHNKTSESRCIKEAQNLARQNSTRSLRIILLSQMPWPQSLLGKGSVRSLCLAASFHSPSPAPNKEVQPLKAEWNKLSHLEPEVGETVLEISESGSYLSKKEDDSGSWLQLTALQNLCRLLYFLSVSVFLRLDDAYNGEIFFLHFLQHDRLSFSLTELYSVVSTTFCVYSLVDGHQGWPLTWLWTTQQWKQVCKHLYNTRHRWKPPQWKNCLPKDYV